MYERRDRKIIKELYENFILMNTRLHDYQDMNYYRMLEYDNATMSEMGRLFKRPAIKIYLDNDDRLPVFMVKLRDGSVMTCYERRDK